MNTESGQKRDIGNGEQLKNHNGSNSLPATTFSIGLIIGGYTMIDPTTYVEWQLLNEVNRHRLKLFSEGKFEVGIFEPELYEITDHQTLNYGFSWATFHLRKQPFAYQLAKDIFADHLLNLSKDTQSE